MLRQFSAGCCKRCGQHAPLKNTAFHRHIGMIVLMHHKQIDTQLCRRCIGEVFWDYTLITALAGWWGMISFFITPLVLVYNIVHYLGALSLPRTPAPAAGTPARPTLPLPLPSSGSPHSPVPLPVPPPITLGQTPRPVQTAIPPTNTEYDLSIATDPQAIPVGTQFGHYAVAKRSSTSVVIKRKSFLSFNFGLIALGCMIAGIVGMCMVAAGHETFAAMALLIPVGLVLTLVWLCIRPEKVQIDAQLREVRLDRTRAAIVWSSDDYYAVYIDGSTAKNGEPMLDLIVAERLTTTAWGGTRIVRCPANDLACADMIHLAAIVAQMLRLPLRSTQDARDVAMSPRLQALLAPTRAAVMTPVESPV